MSLRAAQPPRLRHGRHGHILDLDDQVEATPCAEDPELFFPPGTSWDSRQDQIAQAKAACRTCHVIEACLRWAIDTQEPFAIAGGLTPRERRRLMAPKVARDMSDVDCGTRKGYEQHRRRGEKPCDECRLAANAYNVRYRAQRRAAS